MAETAVKENGMRNAPLAARAGLLMIVALVMSACSATRTQQAPGEVIDDSLLTAKVKAALIEDPVTKARDINVETYRGVVQLGGFVDNAEQKSKATEIARSVTGVQEVRNDLRVSAQQGTVGQSVDDGLITTQVKAKLVGDSRTSGLQINVETQGGVVQLSGFADSNESKARAAELAREVTGVTNVRNDVQIRHGP
jgi:hyperosmotically inducible periplasmic protein